MHSWKFWLLYLFKAWYYISKIAARIKPFKFGKIFYHHSGRQRIHVSFFKNESKIHLHNITCTQILISFPAHTKYFSTPQYSNSNLNFTDNTNNIFIIWQETEEQDYSQIFTVTQLFFKPLNLKWGTCISNGFATSKDSAWLHSIYHMTLSLGKSRTRKKPTTKKNKTKKRQQSTQPGKILGLKLINDSCKPSIRPTGLYSH